MLPGSLLQIEMSARSILRQAIDGHVEDGDRLLAALRKASGTAEGPRGPIKLDAHGNPTEKAHIVARGGGQPAVERQVPLRDPFGGNGGSFTPESRHNRHEAGGLPPFRNTLLQKPVNDICPVR
jgi:hypothetical protein